MSSSMHQKKRFMNTYSVLPARLKCKDLMQSCDCISILMINDAVQLIQRPLILNVTLSINSSFLNKRAYLT